MKTICIDASGLTAHGYRNPLQEGVIYTAHQSPDYSDCYRLDEIPFNEGGEVLNFKKWRFVPLSSIDETEFKREYNKEKV